MYTILILLDEFDISLLKSIVLKIITQVGVIDLKIHSIEEW